MWVAVAGILSERIGLMGGHVTGIDPAKKTIQVAKLHAIESGIDNRVKYRCTTAEDLVSEKRESFDVVIAMETLEHVLDPAETIQALADLCKPQGSIFVATINKTFRAYLLAGCCCRIRPKCDSTRYPRLREISTSVGHCSSHAEIGVLL